MLLDSILNQSFQDYEIVLCEDGSPARPAIRAIAERYREHAPDVVRYFENDRNLGYDGNLRQLIELARGDYCLFMGNDDLLADGALARVAQAVGRHPDIGVVLRTYATFEGSPDHPVQVFRYFEDERFFPSGPQTVSTLFRRSVVISGLVIHRDSAHRYATDRFDGSLLYQLYLVGNVLMEMNAVSVPEILAWYRLGGVPDFGNSAAEQGRFVPKAQTPESSLAFMRGMLAIARDIDVTRGVKVYDRIFRDLGNYSYPILAIQAHPPWTVFVKYCLGLARMGFWKHGLFYLYAAALLVLGPRRSDRLIAYVKRKLGHTPVLGGVYRGKSV